MSRPTIAWSPPPSHTDANSDETIARDFLSGIAALYSTPMFSNIGKKYPTEWASTILAILAMFIVAPLYYFYRKGPEIRMKSKFAQQVAKDRAKQLERRKSGAGGKAGVNGEKQGTEADEAVRNSDMDRSEEEEDKVEHTEEARPEEPHHDTL